VTHLEVEIQNLKDQIKELKDELKEIKKDQKELLAFVYQAQGGKKYLLGLLSVAVTLGIFADQIFKLIKSF
jgi:hypothetical protein